MDMGMAINSTARIDNNNTRSFLCCCLLLST